MIQKVNKRTIEILTFWSGMIFFGFIVSNILITVLTSSSKVGSAKSFYILSILYNVVRSKGTLVLALVFLPLFIAFIRQNEHFLYISIRPKKLINFLVCTYMLSFIIYLPFPAIFVTVALVLLHIISPRSIRIRSNANPFWIALFGFLVLETAHFFFGWIGLNNLRRNASLIQQLGPVTAYLNAFVVYYTIKQNKWEFREFEAFFKILMYFTMIIGLESVVTFYLGIGKDMTLFGVAPLHSIGGLFQSRFIGNYHIAGRLGIVSFFMGIYFYSKYSQKKYLIISFLCFLLIFSTLTRQLIGSTLIPFLLWVLLINRGIGKTAKSALWGYVAVAAFVALSLILFYLADYTQQARGETQSLDHITRRLVMLARGADVFFYTFPFGVGSGMTGYFMAASEIPWTVSDMFGGLLGFDLDAVRRIIYSEKDIAVLGYEMSHSIHNLWARTIVEFGIFGLVFVAYLWWKGWKTFVFLWRCQKRTWGEIDFSATWVVFLMVLALSLSLHFTVKFRFYWFISLLIAFLETNVDSVSHLDQAISLNSLSKKARHCRALY